MNRKVWIGISAVFILLGVIGAVQVLLHGEHVMGTNSFVPLGALLAGYEFFVVSSTGLALIASLGLVFKMKKFEVLAKRANLGSIILLCMGFALMALELGNPLNMVYLLVSPNPQSAIVWMGVLYGVYLVFLITQFYFLSKNNLQAARKIGIIVLLAAVAAHSNLGAVFGFVVARPYWNGPFMSVYFNLLSLLSGAAILAILFYTVSKTNRTENFYYEKEHIVSALGKLLSLFIAITMLFTVVKMLAGLYGHKPGKYEAIEAMISGPLSTNFWLFEVGAGMVLPLLILMLPGGFKPPRVFTAGALTMFGILFMRLDLVAAGQIVPQEVVKGTADVAYRSVSVSPVEWMILLGAIGGSILLFILGEHFFDLNKNSTRYKRTKTAPTTVTESM